MVLKLRTLLAISIASAGIAYATSAIAGDFTPYEGKDSIQEGTGGEKKVVDGVEFWANGAPPRKFQLLGFIDDRRRKSGLYGMARMASLNGSIAKEAKKAGGDAVILVESGAETKGYYSNGNTTGTTNGSVTSNPYSNRSTVYAQNRATTNTATVAVQDQVSRYAVVKYLPDEAPVDAPAAASAGPAGASVAPAEAKAPAESPPTSS